MTHQQPRGFALRDRNQRRIVSCLLGLGVLIALSLVAGGARAQRLAFVDLQRAIEGTTEGKAAIAKLKGDVEKKQKELEGKRDELKKMDEDLSKQAAILKPDAIEKKRQDLQQRFQQLQEALMRSQQEIAEKERKTLAPIQERVMRAIAAIAQREKFTAVLQQQVVLWPQQNEMDITNEVIRKANEK